jgi:hypothetical protein
VGVDHDGSGGSGAGHGVGWDVVTAAAAAAAREFSARLVAVYALGSLAHGGFSPLVSDVDVALVLDGLADDDGDRVESVKAQVRSSGVVLAERLSLFWGATGSLRGEVTGGRLPPLDRLDLLRHGILVRGVESRHGGVEPTTAELIRGAAHFAVQVLGAPMRRREILDGRGTAQRGPRAASKVALFPVRFLYTARTGQMGLVDAAAADYLASARPGSRRDLVAAAGGWRNRWERQDHEAAAELLGSGAVALYREFVDCYVPLLRGDGQERLAGRLGAWGDALSPHS